ncbi:hypothetical protein L1987_85848 [Smallanthus sonchifolius]|uniref:Uncharacterized protein n=1 Tax=Smallanthus sonchifolius TaxID=185202 RepID=A0ACB8XXV9_9ASTR|nr:hypothetical protein L1987_85848 [Smallanthus sonchifolius]
MKNYNCCLNQVIFNLFLSFLVCSKRSGRPYLLFWVTKVDLNRIIKYKQSNYLNSNRFIRIFSNPLQLHHVCRIFSADIKFQFSFLSSMNNLGVYAMNLIH